jgi:four helix bundle protein
LIVVEGVLAGRGFRDLLVWKEGMDLVEQVYRLTRDFPKQELYGLTNQLRRASVSVPSNIAEGQTRTNLKEYLYFISNARGSLALSKQLFALRKALADRG